MYERTHVVLFFFSFCKTLQFFLMNAPWSMSTFHMFVHRTLVSTSSEVTAELFEEFYEFILPN